MKYQGVIDNLKAQVKNLNEEVLELTHSLNTVQKRINIEEGNKSRIVSELAKIQTQVNDINAFIAETEAANQEG